MKTFSIMTRLHFLLFCTVFFFSGMLVHAQLIVGKVTDRLTGEGIAYTNIGVEGTLFGTASNAEGVFELRIPEEYRNKKLYFSAVGYTNRMIGVQELMGRESVTIELDEETYGIEGIDVAAHSKVLYRIIRTASEKIRDNYPKGPFEMKMYYQEELNGQEREAVVRLTDDNGYVQPGIRNAFKSRNYQFVEAKRNFDVYSFRQGNTGIDELLEADLARMGNTLMNQALIGDYDLHLEGSTSFDGDSVWVIDYKTNRTGLAHTGFYHAQRFEGKIYISMSDYGIVRNEIQVAALRQNPQGNSLASSGSAEMNIRSTLVASYRKQNGRYHLSQISSEKQFTSASGIAQNCSKQLVVLEFNSRPGQLLKGRDYFEETPFNDAFWIKFIRPRK